MDCQGESYDYEALYRQALDLARRSQAATLVANRRAEKAEAERDMLVRLCERQGKELRAFRAAQYREEPQAAYVAEIRDASPLMAAIEVHQSQGVR